MLRATIAVLTPLWIGAAFASALTDHTWTAAVFMIASVFSLMFIGDSHGRKTPKV